MSFLVALLALLGVTSPVRADDAPACNLHLAHVGGVLPPSIVASDRVRTVRPGQAVTQEYAPERTTIVLDAEDVVATVRCG